MQKMSDKAASSNLHSKRRGSHPICLLRHMWQAEEKVCVHECMSAGGLPLDRKLSLTGTAVLLAMGLQAQVKRAGGAATTAAAYRTNEPDEKSGKGQRMVNILCRFFVE